MAKQYLGTKLQDLGNFEVLDPTDRILVIKPYDEGIMALSEFLLYVKANLDFSNFLTAKQINDTFATKADTYTRTNADAKFAFVDKTYTKTQSDARFATRADTFTKDEATTLFAAAGNIYLKDEVYSKQEAVQAFALKSEIPILPDLTPYSTTAKGDLRWALKTDVYTKTESDARYPLAINTYSKSDSDVRFAKAANTYTKAEVEAKFLDTTEAYTKSYIDQSIYLKSQVYTKLETDAKFQLKSETYTISDVDTQFAAKSWVYSRGEADLTFATKADTYTKTEVNTLTDSKVNALATNLNDNYYNKSVSDSRYMATGTSYSKSETDTKYPLKTQTVTSMTLSAASLVYTNVDGSNTTLTVPTWNQSTTGNAATATVLQTARTINGVSFNGSANITTPAYNNIYAIDNRTLKPNNLLLNTATVAFSSLGGMNTATANTAYVDVLAFNTYADSSGGTINALAFSKVGGQALYHFIGNIGSTSWTTSKQIAYTDSSITGNAGTATKLATARTFAISGAVTAAGVNFDGTANVSLNATSVDATKLTGIVPNASITGTYSDVTLNITNGLVYAIESSPAGASSTAYGLGSVRAAGTTQNSVIVIKTSIPKTVSAAVNLHLKGVSDSETDTIDITLSGYTTGNFNKLSLGTKDFTIQKAETSDGFHCFVISHPSGYLGASTAFSIVSAHLNYSVTEAYLKNWSIYETTDTSTISNIGQPIDTPASIVKTQWANIQGIPNTVAGYGITDSYVKTDLYTKAQSDAKYALLANVYNKTEIDSKISTIDQIINTVTLSPTALVFTRKNNATINLAIPTWNQSTTGNAATATKLATARTIALTGDGVWSVNFDGTANVTAGFALTPSGVTGGTYSKVTVDTKGRVTAGMPMVPSDIPNIDMSKVTTGILPVTQGGTGATNGSAARDNLGIGTAATYTAGTAPYNIVPLNNLGELSLPNSLNLLTGNLRLGMSTGRSVGGMWLPRSHDLNENVIYDFQDEFAYLDKRKDCVLTTTPVAANSYNMFRNNESFVIFQDPNSTSIVIEADISNEFISVRSSGTYRLGITVRTNATVWDGSVTVETWDKVNSVYVVVYNGVLYKQTYGAFLSPAFESIAGANLGFYKVRITLKNVAMTASAGLGVQRVMLYHGTATFNPWELSRLGGKMYGPITSRALTTGNAYEVTDSTDVVQAAIDYAGNLSAKTLKSTTAFTTTDAGLPNTVIKPDGTIVKSAQTLGTAATYGVVSGGVQNNLVPVGAYGIGSSINISSEFNDTTFTTKWTSLPNGVISNVTLGNTGSVEYGSGIAHYYNGDPSSSVGSGLKALIMGLTGSRSFYRLLSYKNPTSGLYDQNVYKIIDTGNMNVSDVNFKTVTVNTINTTTATTPPNVYADANGKLLISTYAFGTAAAMNTGTNDGDVMTVGSFGLGTDRKASADTSSVAAIVASTQGKTGVYRDENTTVTTFQWMPFLYMHSGDTHTLFSAQHNSEGVRVITWADATVNTPAIRNLYSDKSKVIYNTTTDALPNVYVSSAGTLTRASRTFGTAAERNVTGAGDVITVGTYGLGAVNMANISESIAPQNLPGGFFNYANNSANKPPMVSQYDAFGIHVPRHVNGYGGTFWLPYYASDTKRIVYQAHEGANSVYHVIYSDQNTPNEDVTVKSLTIKNLAGSMAAAPNLYYHTDGKLYSAGEAGLIKSEADTYYAPINASTLFTPDTRNTGDVKPSTLAPRTLRAAFADITKSFGITGSGTYGDVITLNTYADASGGFVNAIVAAKNGTEHALWHARGTFNTASWSGVKQIAYTDSNITGNSATTTKLQTARTIAVSGAVTGTATTFDGTANITIPTTTVDATKLSGIIPNANLSGLYNGFDVELLNSNIIYTKPAAGTAYTAYGIISGVMKGTGAVVIETKIPSTAPSMNQIYIKALTHFSGKILDIVIQWYGSYGRVKNSTGNVDCAVRIALNADNMYCIIIADVTNVWDNAHFSVPLALTNYSTSAAYLKNWSMSLVTDLSPYTSLSAEFTQVDPAIGPRWTTVREKPTTVSGYGITDTYTKSEITSSVSAFSATKLQTARTINGIAFDGTANITVADSTKLPLTGGTLTGNVVVPGILLNRTGNVAAAISWFSGTYNAWQDYMGQAGVAGQGYRGTLTPAAGSLVTNWGRRSFIENAAGYGWVFESGTSGATTPNVVAEIRSSDGSARFGGSIAAGTDITAGGSITASGSISATGAVTVGDRITVTRFNSASAFSFLNGGTAQQIMTGGILVSNSYAEASNVPTNGIYSKGDIKTSGNFIGAAVTQPDGTSNTQLATTAFVQNAVGGQLYKSGLTGGTITLTDVDVSNATLAFGGTLTSNLIVVLPTTNKRLWGISNVTTGDFTLTVKTASGTGVSVSQGRRKLVYCDGANIFDAFTDFESVTVSGAITASTAPVTTNNTQVATTEYVVSRIAYDAPTKTGTGATGTWNIAVTGNAASATKLATARTIGGVAFDGTANISLPGVNAAGNQDTSGNAASATKLQTARTIGGVSFDGTANINLPGVNAAGNQDTTGNAATATKLQTARTIGITGAVTAAGISFDGTSNISINATSVDATKLTGIIPAASLNGLYSDIDIRLNNNRTIYTTNSNSARTVYGLADFQVSNTVTGCIVFKTTIPSNINTMFQLHISGMLYREGLLDIIVKTYQYNGSLSVNAKKVSIGTVDVNIRFAATPDGYTCIILGDIGQSWYYPHISITHALLSVGIAGSSNYVKGWTSYSVNDLTNYTLVTPSFTNNLSVANIAWANIQYKPTTISGYGITDAYTKTDVYTKAEADTKFSYKPESIKSVTLTTTNLSFTNADNTVSNLTIPTWDQSTTGNAGSATKLATARTFTLSGAVTGSASFDGTANPTIATTLAASPALTGVPTAPTAAVGNSTTQIATTAFVNAEIANDAPTKTGTGATGTWNIAVTGNAATATKLQTTRTINGVAFDGTTNIVTPATGTVIATDDRAMVPNDLPLRSLGVYFTSKGGLETTTVNASYGDFLALNTYGDSSGGGVNGLFFAKGVQAIYHYYAPFGSTNPFPTPKQIAYTDSDITGNAATATKLATARTINGVSFDGTANITVADSTKLPTAGGTVTGNLTVNGTTTADVSNSTNFGISSTSGTAGNGISLYGGAVSTVGVLPSYGFSFSAPNTFGTHGSVTATDWAVYLTCVGATNRGWIFKNTASGTTGNVASISGTGNAQFNGSVYAGGDVTAFSDKRLKENITPIVNALSKVKELNGVTYTRNDLEDKELGHIGLIAQDVQAVFPEAVRENSDGYLTLNYMGLVGSLVEAIKELDTKNQSLETRLAKLEELIK